MAKQKLKTILGYTLPILFAGIVSCDSKNIEQPNVVIIYADDIGYGDLSCYGAKAVSTPNVDRLAAEGIRFTDAYASAATCTPSRYGILTGQYPFRRNDTGIARGDAPMIIRKEQYTVASLMQDAGYSTGVIGKWHLGLGEGGFNCQDWNGIIKPGPNEIGFGYSYIMAATGDRTPCVFIENGEVVNLDPDDPIEVSYTTPFEGEPLGRTHPELLKMHPSGGHDMAIVNGISRIGYMRGGKSALWVDENFADSITLKAVKFIERNNPEVTDKPFFLFFGTHDIHVPRVPHPRFAGVTDMGPRGDAIAEFDWSVGQILEALDRLGLADNTMVILSSDNGPVVDDGYKDQAVELLGDHKPWGPYRGGKYSAFEAGTRIPFIIRWPKRINTATSNAQVSQIDLFAVMSQLTGQPIPGNAAPDSFGELDAWLGQSSKGRDYIIQQSSGTLSIVEDGWKYIVPSKAARYNSHANIELGNDTVPQLYNLTSNPAETINLAKSNPQIVEKMAHKIEQIKANLITRNSNIN
jgi:arylsulfatase A-like enzyme